MKELSRRRQQLVDHMAVEKQRLRHDITGLAKASLQRSIDYVAGEIKEIEQAMEEEIKQSEVSQAKVARLETFKGVGRRSACLLVSLLPELDQLNRADIAALVGVAPKNKDSGRKRGYRFIQGGRFDVRKIVYMIALVSIRFNPVLKEFYERLRKKSSLEGEDVFPSHRRDIKIPG